MAVIHVKDFTVKDGKVISMAAGQGIMDYSDQMCIRDRSGVLHVLLEGCLSLLSLRRL